MKKTIIVAIFSSTLLVGCGQAAQESVSSSQSKTDVQTSVVKEPENEDTAQNGQAVDKFDGQSDIGDGTLALVGSDGATAEGQQPSITYKSGETPVEIGVETTDVNGDMVSYLYVDGQLVGKKQLSNSNEKVELQDVPTALVAGDHKLQLVQYEADAEDGNILTYKEQPFTVIAE